MSGNETPINGAQLVIELMQSKGIDVCFGYPGGAIINFYDELYKSSIKHYLVRHEQGAIHMAEGFAKVSGKLGVCLSTSGPGATNFVTGLADANMDSIPVMAITGQVATNVIGTDAFQEADIYGITVPITKYNALIKNVDDIARIFEEAYCMAMGRRPGPVLLDFPKDMQIKTTQVRRADKLKIAARHYENPPITGDIDAVIHEINKSERPLFYVGGGAVISHSHAELRQIAESADIPVTTTLMGIGAFPGTHPLSLGMLGMHGTAYANRAILETDLIIGLGVRFDDRVAKIGDFAPKAKKIHIDIDPAEFNKRISVDYTVHGNLKDALSLIGQKIESKKRTAWNDSLNQIKQKHPLFYDKQSEEIKPQEFLSQVYQRTQGKAIVSTDVGQHQMWAAQFMLINEPDSWLTSGGLGTMGYGMPAAIGAKIARPDKLVLCITGDGSIQMCIQELATIAAYNIPIKIIIFNNTYLGMVRQWQELFFGERYSQTNWSFHPDFVKLANAYGLEGRSISHKREIDSAIDFLLKDESKASILEVKIPWNEMVMPMIPAGQSQKDMIEYADLERMKKK